MNSVYLKFEVPKSTELSEPKSLMGRTVENIAIGFLTKFIPKANPDFDSKIDDVKYWLIEIEKSDDIPQREIGLNSEGQPIMKMPWNKNYGYWTDNNLKLADFENAFDTVEIDKQVFEDHWNRFGSKN